MREEEIQKMHKQADKDFSYRINVEGDYRDTWRIFRIMAEFVEGYNFLASFKDEVTILGSARLEQKSEYCQTARWLGKMLGENGFTTITGGGPGIMQAANQGAQEGKGESVGINIQLPFEQRVNPYVGKSVGFYYFFTRKVMLTSPANAFVFFPGGFGTMDEFFEIVDLMELKKMQPVPIVLVGKDFWQPLLDFLENRSCQVGSVEAKHINAWHLVETAEEAFEYIKDTKDKENICELSPGSFHCDDKIDWKIFRIMSELVEGFEFLTGLVDDVTVLGTKSIEADHHYYKAAHDLGVVLARDEFSVVSGGGPGIMEAVSKGCFEAGGESIGINMKYGFKERRNDYLKKSIGFQFPYVRKLIVTAPSKAFVFFPGGFGTMHQLFEVLTLLQTKKMQPLPVLLYDHEFWQPLMTFIKKVMIADLKTVAPKDDELFQIVDDVDSAMRIINEFKKGGFGRK